MVNPSRAPEVRQPDDAAFRLLVKNVVDYAIFMLDTSGHIMSWNAGAERIKGYSAEEILGKHFSVFYPPEDIAADKPGRELKIALAQRRLEDEGWRLRQDGSRFWANVVITALYDDQGRHVGFGKVTRDMTERMRAELALRESEDRFRLMVQGVLDYAIFMLDTSGHIVSWNAGAERIKGYSAEEILGKHFSVFYPPEDIAADKPGRELKEALAQRRLEDEGWRLRQDGSRFWANVVITAIYDDQGRHTGFGKVTRDMTERRQTARELAEGRRLMAHLVEAQEAERRRIAWDVHDDSIQAMVAVGMRLQLLAGRLSGQDAATVRQLDDAVRTSVSRLRNLVFRLRPPALDRNGLDGVLDTYLADVVGSWGMAHSLRYELDREPPAETAITIFRVCQEALTNVHKHARATTVEVSLREVDGGILVHVADDGIGVADAPGQPAGHFGVIEMRERAETAGGWLAITGDSDIGTTVDFWLPIPTSPGSTSTGEPAP